MPAFVVYLVRCADGTLYTGVTTDVDARLKAHNAGCGARYTAGRTPVSVVYVEPCDSRSSALKREHAIKRLSRARKLHLVSARSAGGGG